MHTPGLGVRKAPFLLSAEEGLFVTGNMASSRLLNGDETFSESSFLPRASGLK